MQARSAAHRGPVAVLCSSPWLPSLSLSLSISISLSLALACPATIPAQSKPSPRAATPRSDSAREIQRVQENTGLTFSIFRSKLRRNLIRTGMPYGFKIKRVAAGSPADRAGLKKGWILMMWDGKPVREVGDIDRLLWCLDAGSKVDLHCQRRALGGPRRHPWVGSRARLEVRRPHPLRQLGIEVDMDDGKKEGKGKGNQGEGDKGEGNKGKQASPQPKGVLVRRVDPASAAARAGLRDGDVILRWDQTRVHTFEDLRRPFFRNLGKQGLELQVARRERRPRDDKTGQKSGSWRQQRLRLPAWKKEAVPSKPTTRSKRR